MLRVDADNMEKEISILQQELDSYKEIVKIRNRECAELEEKYHNVCKTLRDEKDEWYARQLVFQQLQHNCREYRKECNRLKECATKEDVLDQIRKTHSKERGQLKGLNHVLCLQVKTLQTEKAALHATIQQLLDRLKSQK